MEPHIMYIKEMSPDMEGKAWIGRVSYSKTGKMIYYRGKCFQRLKNKGNSKANYFDTVTEERYWISSPHTEGKDRLFWGLLPVEIDDDVREEYWIFVRHKPENRERKTL